MRHQPSQTTQQFPITLVRNSIFVATTNNHHQANKKERDTREQTTSGSRFMYIYKIQLNIQSRSLSQVKYDTKNNRI